MKFSLVIRLTGTPISQEIMIQYIIYCQDRNSVYPLQLRHTDIISQYRNSALMEHFNA